MSLKILAKRQQAVSQGLQLHQRCLLIDLLKTFHEEVPQFDFKMKANFRVLIFPQ